MIGFLFGRLLPAGAAMALLTSALSPLTPALNAFGVAANALAGESNAGGQAMPDSLDLPGSGSPGSGFFASLFSRPQRKDNARRQIEGLVESLKEKKEREAVLPAKKKAAKAKKKG